MNGKTTAILFKRWQSLKQPYLTDDELKELYEGLAKIQDFLCELRTENSAFFYWHRQKESIMSAIEAREHKN
jgi:hypothetical protein